MSHRSESLQRTRYCSISPPPRVRHKTLGISSKSRCPAQDIAQESAQDTAQDAFCSGHHQQNAACETTPATKQRSLTNDYPTLLPRTNALLEGTRNNGGGGAICRLRSAKRARRHTSEPPPCSRTHSSAVQRKPTACLRSVIVAKTKQKVSSSSGILRDQQDVSAMITHGDLSARDVLTRDRNRRHKRGHVRNLSREGTCMTYNQQTNGSGVGIHYLNGPNGEPSSVKTASMEYDEQGELPTPHVEGQGHMLKPPFLVNVEVEGMENHTVVTRRTDGAPKRFHETESAPKRFHETESAPKRFQETESALKRFHETERPRPPPGIDASSCRFPSPAVIDFDDRLDPSFAAHPSCKTTKSHSSFAGSTCIDDIDTGYVGSTSSPTLNASTSTHCPNEDLRSEMEKSIDSEDGVLERQGAYGANGKTVDDVPSILCLDTKGHHSSFLQHPSLSSNKRTIAEQFVIEYAGSAMANDAQLMTDKMIFDEMTEIASHNDGGKGTGCDGVDDYGHANGAGAGEDGYAMCDGSAGIDLATLLDGGLKSRKQMKNLKLRQGKPPEVKTISGNVAIEELSLKKLKITSNDVDFKDSLACSKELMPGAVQVALNRNKADFDFGLLAPNVQDTVSKNLGRKKMKKKTKSKKRGAKYCKHCCRLNNARRQKTLAKKETFFQAADVTNLMLQQEGRSRISYEKKNGKYICRGSRIKAQADDVNFNSGDFKPDTEATASSFIGEYLYELWKNQCMCDVRIQSETSSFLAHKIVLAAFSDVFCPCEPLPKPSLCVTVPNTSGDAIYQVLLYLYTSEMELSDDTMQDVLNAAVYLGVQDVTDLIKDILQNPTIDNVIKYLEIAQNLSLDITLMNMPHILRNHLREIWDSEPYKNLTVDDIITVLNDKELKVDGEWDILEAVCQWAEYDFPARVTDTLALLQFVSFVCIDAQTLTNIAEKYERVFDHKDIQHVLVHLYKAFAMICVNNHPESFAGPKKEAAYEECRQCENTSPCNLGAQEALPPVKRQDSTASGKSGISTACGNRNERRNNKDFDATRNAIRTIDAQFYQAFGAPNCSGGRTADNFCKKDRAERLASVPPNLSKPRAAGRPIRDQRGNCGDQRPNCGDQRPNCGDQRANLDQRGNCGERANCGEQRPNCGDQRPNCGDQRANYDQRANCGERTNYNQRANLDQHGNCDQRGNLDQRGNCAQRGNLDQRGNCGERANLDQRGNCDQRANEDRTCRGSPDYTLRANLSQISNYNHRSNHSFFNDNESVAAGQGCRLQAEGRQQNACGVQGRKLKPPQAPPPQYPKEDDPGNRANCARRIMAQRGLEARETGSVGSIGSRGTGLKGIGSGGSVASRRTAQTGIASIRSVGTGQRGIEQRGCGQMGMGQNETLERGIGQRECGQLGIEQRGCGQMGMGQMGMGPNENLEMGMGQTGCGQRGMGENEALERGMGQMPPNIPNAPCGPLMMNTCPDVPRCSRAIQKRLLCPYVDEYEFEDGSQMDISPRHRLRLGKNDP